MKKVISIICITLLVALYSCDERIIHSDIDDLTERVANLGTEHGTDELGHQQLSADG
ncbi:MAG: hypothetical protein V8R12_15165 [Bacteroides faecis]